MNTYHKLPDGPQKNAVYERARSVFTRKVLHYSRLMGVTFNRITIREQKTRWGSCSTRRNLNFNWRLLLAPEEILDYVVVHELAHLKQMNHSKDFYAVVRSVLPNYKNLQNWLKKNGHLLFSMDPGHIPAPAEPPYSPAKPE